MPRIWTILTLISLLIAGCGGMPPSTPEPALATATSTALPTPTSFPTPTLIPTPVPDMLYVDPANLTWYDQPLDIWIKLWSLAGCIIRDVAAGL